MSKEILESALDLGVRCGVSSWIELKKVLLLSLPPSQRSKFSTRDPVSKQQFMNELERSIVDNYERMTGIRLEVPNGKR